MHRSRSVALLTALLLPLAACGGEADDGPNPGDASGADGQAEREAATEEPDTEQGTSHGTSGGAGDRGDGMTVVASVYPLAWVAEQIAPGARIELLGAAGDDPHDVELTPRGRELLETADLVLYMGDITYQPQVETAVQASTGDVVSFVDVVGEGALRTRGDHGDDDHENDHGNDDGHDHEDDHGNDDGHDHDHNDLDPHAWFDAALMAEATEAIGRAFANSDESAAGDYAVAAGSLASDFREVDAAITDLFETGCAHDRVIVSHEAYAYLVEPFGLSQEGVSGAGGHGPASPQRIAELVEIVRDEGIEFVLAEPIEGREDAQAVAGEAGVEVLDVYSLEVVDDEDLFEERGFLRLLREQAETVARGLGCG